MQLRIFATKFVENLAQSLAQSLALPAAWCVTVHVRSLTPTDIHEVNAATDTLLFIMCPHIFLQARQGPSWPASLPLLQPGKYILYQLEQLDQQAAQQKSVFWNPHIWQLMHHALYIFDYSEQNLAQYPAALRDKSAWLLPPMVTVPAQLQNQTNPTKDIDILFMGALTPYRQHMLSFIRQNLPATLRWQLIHNVFGPALTDTIGKAKVVLNIRSGASKQLEVCRLHECIGWQHVHVVSEHECTTTKCICARYRDRVHFAATAQELVAKVKLALQSFPAPFSTTAVANDLTPLTRVLMLTKNFA